MSEMSEGVYSYILSAGLENGYAFKNFFLFAATVRGRPIISFLPNLIKAANRTADDQVYGSVTLVGDEIKLEWANEIPIEKRNLSLALDSNKIQTIFGRIKKKDHVQIQLIQVRGQNAVDDFDGPNSSNQFLIFISCGGGGDGREGIQYINSVRVKPEITLIKYPDHSICSRLVIPIRAFRAMIDNFNKRKNYNEIKIVYYQNNENDLKDPKDPPGIMIATDINGAAGGIVEKYGYLPTIEAGNPISDWVPNEIKIDEDAIVRPNRPTQVIVEVDLIKTNEFYFKPDKIPIFLKLASMHNEGSVRVYYQPGFHLQIVYHYGAFGECEICLSSHRNKT